LAIAAGVLALNPHARADSVTPGAIATLSHPWHKPPVTLTDKGTTIKVSLSGATVAVAPTAAGSGSRATKSGSAVPSGAVNNALLEGLSLHLSATHDAGGAGTLGSSLTTAAPAAGHSWQGRATVYAFVSTQLMAVGVKPLAEKLADTFKGSVHGGKRGGSGPTVIGAPAGGANSNYSGPAIGAPALVPEPASLVLLGLALGGLIAHRHLSRASRNRPALP
jgi:hypothetical protein